MVDTGTHTERAVRHKPRVPGRPARPAGTSRTTRRRTGAARALLSRGGRAVLPWVLATPLAFSDGAGARPTAPDAFCAAAPQSPLCQGQVVACSTCHAGPPALNPFGVDVAVALPRDTPFEAGLALAIDHVGTLDSDADGTDNLEEITLGTLPADPFSVPTPLAPAAGDNPFYALDTWDAALALRRVAITYCGESPTKADLDALEDAADPRAAVHAALDACLQSAFWRTEALPRLADPRIEPDAFAGADADDTLADYRWDYRLFVHALTDGRDARDLLLADYHIAEDGSRIHAIVPRPEPQYDATLGKLWSGGGQPVPREHRAGMLTTQWFLAMNTMFSQLPRTTAAQAYRAYLGQDIAQGEGIHPVAGEPRDVDQKGVDAPACAACHSTLDPLAYAFSAYNGLDALTSDRFDEIFAANTIGAYAPERTPWDRTSTIMHTPVHSVRAWAEVAAGTEAFRRTLATMFFQHMFDDAPLAHEFHAFRTAYERLRDTGHSADALLHDLVDTDAFGRP